MAEEGRAQHGAVPLVRASCGALGRVLEKAKDKVECDANARTPTLDGSWQGSVRLLYSALCDVHNGAIVLSGYLADQLLRWGASRTKVRASIQRLEN